MAFSVVMPALEMAQETGKLVAWRKKEGESVAKGEPLLEVETDKAVLEVEAPADGVLAGVSVYEGAVVPVGKTIAWIVRPGEAAPAEDRTNGSGVKAAAEPAKLAAATSPVSREPDGMARISPKARRLAKEKNVDISHLRGSGPDGEILTADVLAATESSARETFETPGAVGRLMAERTTQSWTTVPHFFVSREVDASALVQARERMSPAGAKAHSIRPTHTDILVAAIARTLTKHQRLNASWLDGRIRSNLEVNIAIAMAVEDGVVAAVVPNADKLSVAEIAVRRRDLAERARANRLNPADIRGASFTISNLGMYQVDAFSAIISPPQAAILAVGSIREHVTAVAGQPAVRPMMTLTLSCDHRVVDGARAAFFLQDLVEALRQPGQWLR
jgi:pyruvate dehydrogenase E2 component (dihydrolipoamide acetyltransferase)